jgi:hypothetical protein
MAPRCSARAIVLADGWILFTPSWRVFDPADRSWTTIAPAPATDQKTGGFAGVVLGDGRLLAIGGYGQAMGCWRTPTVSALDVALGTWTTLRPMARGRHYHGAVALPDGRVVVSAGEGACHAEWTSATATAELFDPTSNTWSSLPAMSYRRAEGIGGPSVPRGFQDSS